MEQHLLIHRAVVHREATQTVVIIAERFLRFQNRAIISSAIMNVILRSFSVNYGLIYYILLYLKAGDGDLLLITELALLTRCA